MQKINLEKVRATLKETDFPSVVVVEVVYGCNLNCSICPLDTMTRQPYFGRPTGLRGVMDEGHYKKICQEIGEKGQAIGTQLWLPLMGEPFIIGEKAIDYITIAKKFNVPKIIINSNGTLLYEKLTDKILKSGLDEIYFGIDGTTQETYGKIRCGGDLEKVKRNVIYMLKRKKELGLDKPKINVQFVVTDVNLHEEKKFRKFWLKQGAVVKIRKKLGWGTSFSTEELVSPQSARNMPCPWLIRTISICQNGTVLQCDADYAGKFPVGDLSKEGSTIQKIWLGDLKERRIRHWNNDFSHPLCRVCNDWQCGLSEFHKPKERQ